MLKAAGLTEVGDNTSQSSSGVLGEKRSADPGIVSETGGSAGVRHHAERSILGETTGQLTELDGVYGVAFLKEALAAARYRPNMECPAFRSFMLPNGDLLEPHRSASGLKRAFAGMQPMLQQAPHLQ